MQAIETFLTWFIQEFPAFLMAEPIVYFIAIMILGYMIDLLISIARRY